MIDPIELSRKAKDIVCENSKRKYYRFRPARYYGGIATGDCVGCNLRCKYCWAWNMVNNPQERGRFYSPEKVSDNLVRIARENDFRQVRISGNEPTLAREHLLRVLENIPRDLVFILETNGILLGYDENYSGELSEFDNLHVRVSLKATNKQEFSRITGAKEEGFGYQIKALEHLEGNGTDYHPALAGVDLIPDGNIKDLVKRLKEINPNLSRNLERESLIRYPQVISRLKKRGLI